MKCAAWIIIQRPARGGKGKLRGDHTRSRGELPGKERKPLLSLSSKEEAQSQIKGHNESFHGGEGGNCVISLACAQGRSEVKKLERRHPHGRKLDVSQCLAGITMKGKENKLCWRRGGASKKNLHPTRTGKTTNKHCELMLRGKFNLAQHSLSATAARQKKRCKEPCSNGHRGQVLESR